MPRARSTSACRPTPPSSRRPAPASGLTATAGDGAIDLAWNAPAAGTPGDYRVERQPLNGEWTNIAGTTAASHSDNTVQPNAAHRYRVQHRNQHGGSTWTESGEVMLLAVPGKPTGLTAATGGNDNVDRLDRPRQPLHRRLPGPAPHRRR